MVKEGKGSGLIRRECWKGRDGPTSKDARRHIVAAWQIDLDVNLALLVESHDLLALPHLRTPNQNKADISRGPQGERRERRDSRRPKVRPRHRGRDRPAIRGARRRQLCGRQTCWRARRSSAEGNTTASVSFLPTRKQFREGRTTS